MCSSPQDYIYNTSRYYREGYKAFKDGKQAHENPYCFMRELLAANAWEDGYMGAKQVEEPNTDPQPAGEHLQMSATDHEYDRGAFGVCRQCGREAKDHR